MGEEIEGTTEAQEVMDSAVVGEASSAKFVDANGLSAQTSAHFLDQVISASPAGEPQKEKR